MQEGYWWFGGVPYANFFTAAGFDGPKVVNVIGEDVSGDDTSLLADDGNDLCAFNDATTLQAIFTLSYDFLELAPTTLNVEFEHAVGRAGLQYNYKLKNFNTNAFVTISGGLAPQSFTVVSYENTTTADTYVDANGQLQIRITYGPLLDEAVALDGWTHCISYLAATAN